MPLVTFSTGLAEVGRQVLRVVPRKGERILLGEAPAAYRILDMEWDLTGEEQSATAIVELEAAPSIAQVLKAANDWTNVLEHSRAIIACAEVRQLVAAVTAWRKTFGEPPRGDLDEL